jgi:Ca2+-binding RTX toxin-like protein
MGSRLAVLALLVAATLVATGPVQAAQSSPTSCDGERPTIVGTPHADRLVGTSGSDVIFGGGGADVIIGRGGNDRLCGGDGNDRIQGGNGRDTVSDGNGNDRLEGNKGIDSFIGNSNCRADGTDVYLGGPDKDKFRVFCQGDDRINGGTGNDQISLTTNRTGGLRARGGPGDDNFKFSASSDLEIAGGVGHDTVTATIYNDMEGQRATFDYRVGEITTSYDEGVVKVSGINATVARFLPSPYTTRAYFYGTPGDDELSLAYEPPGVVAFGYGGNDTFRTDGGDDTLDGGAGRDRAEADGGLDTCVNFEITNDCEQ